MFDPNSSWKIFLERLRNRINELDREQRVTMQLCPSSDRLLYRWLRDFIVGPNTGEAATPALSLDELSRIEERKGTRADEVALLFRSLPYRTMNEAVARGLALMFADAVYVSQPDYQFGEERARSNARRRLEEHFAYADQRLSEEKKFAYSFNLLQIRAGNEQAAVDQGAWVQYGNDPAKEHQIRIKEKQLWLKHPLDGVHVSGVIAYDNDDEFAIRVTIRAGTEFRIQLHEYVPCVPSGGTIFTFPFEELTSGCVDERGDPEPPAVRGHWHSEISVDPCAQADHEIVVIRQRDGRVLGRFDINGQRLFGSSLELDRERVTGGEFDPSSPQKYTLITVDQVRVEIRDEPVSTGTLPTAVFLPKPFIP